MNNHWQTILAIDCDKHAAATYRANFPGVEVRCASVADELNNLPCADVICAGPPCQPFSRAGNRKGADDARDCIPDFIEAVRRVKPRMFIMENVAGLMTMEDGQYAQRTMTALEGAGYAVEVRVQDAVSFGSPQFRKRCWWWGIRRDVYDEGVRHVWPQPTHAWPPPSPNLFGAGSNLLAGVTVGEALGHDGCRVELRLEGHGNFAGRNFDQNNPAPTIRGGSLPGGGDIILYRWSDAMRQKHPPASTTEPASTIQAKFFKGGAEGLLDCTGWKQKGELWVRRLTPLECMRLQSGPDDFRWPEGISKTAMYRVIGNGWACAHAAAFSRALAMADPKCRTVIDLFAGGGLGAVGWHGRYWTYQPRAADAAADAARPIVEIRQRH